MKYYKILKESSNEVVGLSHNYYKPKGYVTREINHAEFEKLKEILIKKVRNA